MAYSKSGGMILISASTIVPSGFLRCDGQEISRTTYANLFTLAGTTFGVGDGSTTFNLPNLVDRVVIGLGNSGDAGISTYALADVSGEASHTLTITEIPTHRHQMNASAAAGQADPFGRLPGNGTSFSLYASAADSTNLNSTAIGSTGGSGGVASAHENRQPFLGLTYLIATDDVDGQFDIGEIRLILTTSIPSGWLACDGASTATASEPNLFAVTGYQFGGSGANFLLPDLQGRTPIHVGSGNGLTSRSLGEKGGAESVTLTTPNLPIHRHLFSAAGGRSSRTNVNTTSGNLPAAMVPGTDSVYGSVSAGTLIPMDADAVRDSGSGAAHENRMPSIALQYIIAKSL